MTSMPSAGDASPAAETKKQHWGRWIALGCGALVVLVGLFVVLLVFVVKKVMAGPEEVV